jgi:acyl-CoA synthetase (AMP-forming)/AMP-acid ligase II
MHEYVTQPLHRALQQCPNRPMTIFGDRTRTVSQFVDRVARLAAGLRSLGVKPGDRVGMLALNSDRYMEYFFAVPWAGGVLNSCNTRWSPAEIVYSLEDCETNYLIVDDTFKDAAASFRAQAKSLRYLIYAGEGATPNGMIGYEALIEGSTPMPDTRRGGDELLGVFYTGGTTGFPKGVMISHRGFMASSLAMLAEGVCPRDCPILRAAPMFHMADGAFGYAGVLANATHVVIAAFHPTRVLEAISRHKVSATVLVPTMIQMLIADPAAKTTDMSSLRRLVYGASPIAERTVIDLMSLWPHVELMQAYGQTELSPLATVLGPEHHFAEGRAAGMLRSCGRASYCVEIAIVDSASKEVPRGTVGEIAARGPNVMRGYWNKPEQTKAAMTDDGWLRTGDGAYMDERGYVFIIDRVKDMIVTGGENVFSAEVENAIGSHPAVAMCAVIGIPSEEWGEAVHAVVVAKNNAYAPFAEEIIAHCKQSIAGYKCPKSVEFRASLPLSGAGKILKAELREPFWRDRGRRVA